MDNLPNENDNKNKETPTRLIILYILIALAVIGITFLLTHPVIIGVILLTISELFFGLFGRNR